MLERILPAGVAIVSTTEDALEVPLYPEEEVALGHAVEKRRREFVTARACARQAIARLGRPPEAIPAGPKGEPLWPAGIVGSITHCEGYRACALAPVADFLTIGIDAELDEPLPQGVLGDIALAPERERLRSLAREVPTVNWDRLLFSIKESVYKAWFPLAQRWLGFEDAVVTIDRDRGAFSARLLVATPDLEGRKLGGFSGRWLVGDGLLFAAIAVPSRRVERRDEELGGDRQIDED